MAFGKYLYPRAILTFVPKAKHPNRPHITFPQSTWPHNCIATVRPCSGPHIIALTLLARAAHAAHGRADEPAAEMPPMIMSVSSSFWAARAPQKYRVSRAHLKNSAAINSCPRSRFTRRLCSFSRDRWIPLLRSNFQRHRTKRKRRFNF